jgi:hypothetical protein
MDNKTITADFFAKMFPENYKITKMSTCCFKLETPFLDDFNDNIVLFADTSDPTGKVKIFDAETIFGDLGILKKSNIEKMVTYVNTSFPKNCHFVSEKDKELVYEVEANLNSPNFEEEFKLSLHYFITLMSKIYGFLEFLTM